jgi:phage-related holin
MEPRETTFMKQLLISLAISTFSVLAPIHAVLIAVGVIIFGDLITGVWAAYIRGEKISSAGLRRTISKIFVYNLAIVLGFVIEQYLISNALPISKIAAGLIGVTEGLSIFENLNSIAGNNVFKSLLDKLGSVNQTNKPKGEVKEEEKK